MRILLDENISPKFGKLLSGHDVIAIAGSELRSISDRELLRIANEKFDAIVTMDKGLIHQQNLKDSL